MCREYRRALDDLKKIKRQFEICLEQVSLASPPVGLAGIIAIQQISSYASDWFVVGKYILMVYYYKENVCVVNRDTPLGIFAFCSLDTEGTRACKRYARPREE